MALVAFGFASPHAGAPASSSSQAASPADPYPLQCPLQTTEAWQHFLDEHADNPGWVQTCEDSACDKEYYAFVRDEIQRTFRICAPFLARHERIARCTANYRRFVPAWMLQHDSVSYGFTVDNHTYLSRQEASDKPSGMMTPPPVILEALPDRARVEEAARKHGFKYLTHDSAISGTRTFVLNPDPQDRFDQWLLLNLKSGDSSVQSQQPLSILAVQKRDAAGHLLEKVRLHFRDYAIDHSVKGYAVHLNETSSGKCYSCHTNGVRQLIARRTPVMEAKPVRGEPGFREEDASPGDREFAYERLQEFNRRLRSYGAPDWEGMVVPEDHGPRLGEAQGCTDCHNGKSRSALTVSTSVDQLEKKMYHELSMPYDTELPRLVERLNMSNPPLDEKSAETLRQAFLAAETLTVDFYNSRLPALKRWLLEVPCQ